MALTAALRLRKIRAAHRRLDEAARLLDEVHHDYRDRSGLTVDDYAAWNVVIRAAAHAERARDALADHP